VSTGGGRSDNTFWDGKGVGCHTVSSEKGRKVEDALGMLLLERNGWNSRLTDAGEIVYKHATSILAESEDLVTELPELRGLRNICSRKLFPSQRREDDRFPARRGKRSGCPAVSPRRAKLQKPAERVVPA
jgi:hypothetical protein